MPAPGASTSHGISKPIIPAVIGLFTYGSSSPYALVLCIEHYLNDGICPKPISTHVATLLSLVGSLVWFALNIAYAPQILGTFVGRPLGMYGEIGVKAWIATAVFLCWAFWRFALLLRREHCTAASGDGDG